MPRVRRVVTGHGEAGKAVVVSDTDVQPTDPQFAPKWSIWSADAPVVLPNGGARPDFTGPLIPEPWRVPRLVLTLLAYFNPDSMFDTSDPARAAQTARAQTAGAVAVVADPNPAASYGTIPGFTGLPAGATTATSPRSWSAWSSAPSTRASRSARGRSSVRDAPSRRLPALDHG